ncbi:MAG: hemolysin family protein [Rickettsiales bacterium]
MNHASPAEGDSKHVSPYEAPSSLQKATRWFRERMLKRGGEGTLKEMIEEALEEEAGGVSTISDEEKSLLKNMIHFGELTVYDVMVPRSDIMGLKRDVTLEELKAHIIEIGHTRVPVYEDSLDQIDGFIHVKDLFPYLASSARFDIAELLREVLFVPPSMRIVDLLVKMRVSGCHMAIVVDEFGGTDGLLTMEDLFEQLVGEIQDEHDGHENEPHLKWLGDHVVEADARTPIEHLSGMLGGLLNDTMPATADIDTLGGLIFSMLGRVPARGEVVMLKPDLKAEILVADPRRIRQVRLTKIPVSA